MIPIAAVCPTCKSHDMFPGLNTWKCVKCGAQHAMSAVKQ